MRYVSFKGNFLQKWTSSFCGLDVGPLILCSVALAYFPIEGSLINYGY